MSPFLCIGTMIALAQSLGYMPLSNIVLNSLVMNNITSFPPVFNISACVWSRPQAFPDLRFVTAFWTSSTLISWFREWFVSSDTSCSCTFDSSTVSLAAWPSILLKWSYQTFISVLSLALLFFSPSRLFRSFQNTDAFIRLVATSAALFLLNSFFLLYSSQALAFVQICIIFPVFWFSRFPKWSQFLLTFSFRFSTFSVKLCSTFGIFFSCGIS